MGDTRLASQLVYSMPVWVDPDKMSKLGVTATDISAPMLALASAKPRVAGMACIEYMECSASALAVLADVFDIALC